MTMTMPQAGQVDQLLAQAEVELQAAVQRRERGKATMAYVIHAANSEGRPALTAEETQTVTDARTARDQARRDIADIQAKIATLRDIQGEEADYVAQSQRTRPTGEPAGTWADGAVHPRERTAPAGEPGRELPAYDQVHRVGREERTYSRGSDPHGRQFIKDVTRAFVLSDPGAQSRLARHMAEERVELAAGYLERAAGDNTTANWAGLTVPQYLTDMYAPVARALRPFADICNKHPLPAEGMALDISRVTTGTSVAAQASELDQVSLTSADDTLLTINVLTAAGGQKVSRQAIERARGTEDILMQDLFDAYASSLDSQLITTATVGLSAVAQAVTYTDTTPTAPELYPKILNGMSNVEGALMNRGYPTHAVMHSRRWYWLASQMTSSWPFISSGNVPPQAGGVANENSTYDSGVRGVLPIGLKVIVDNNIGITGGTGTNEDELYVVPARECHLWEDPGAPVYIRAEQANASNLAIMMVVYGYFAFTFGRYTNAMAKVSGTGLVTPTF